jgi:UDP-N-acetylmuramate dehydrogenase
MNERGLLRVARTGMTVDTAGCEADDLAFCGAVQVRVGADFAWEALVEHAVASDWVGVESLAGLEGSVADVSAYGQAVADTVVAVRTWDRATDAQRTFPLVECGFTPGSSRFQELLSDNSLRFDILDVTFLFRQGSLAAPVLDPALASALGIAPGHRAPLSEVRDALRRR